MSRTESSNIPLHLRTVADATRHTYEKAIADFLTWTRQHHTSFSLGISSTSDTDNLLAEYFNHLYNTNPSRGNLQKSVNCRAGILLHYPQLESRLPLAKASIKGWGHTVPRSQRPPIPACLVFVMIRLFIKRNLLELALVTWLGFDGYFRISEIFKIRTEDAVMQGNLLAIFLGRSKTGLNQSVVINHPQLIILFQHFSGIRGGQAGFLFTTTVQQYRVAWHSILQELDADQHGFTPHSLRHGGATDDFISARRSLEQIMQRGRWQQEKTTRNYLQAARALVLHISIKESYRNKGLRLQLEPEKIIKDLSHGRERSI